ncbi:MAG: class I SAM-dependent methyltransferase [Sandaracinaceae bacterium]|nr:class I SAM-dependent methyltransferase [Sandaracinaceae bacterium]
MDRAPDELSQLTESLLRCSHAGEAKPVVDALVARLAELTGVELHPDGFRDEHATLTARGKAVSLTTAAQCGEDVERTRVFLQGVHAGLVHALARVPEHAPVHVLYAGTGPFGLLLVPLLPLLPPAHLARLRVTLLDIHAESLATLKVVVDHLGVQESIEAFVQADACEWQPPQRFDVILSETMHAGLEREPQVSVFAHLSGFLAEDGVLIPEAVVVNLWLSRGRGAPHAPGEGSRKHLGQLFRLDRQTAEQLGTGDHSALQGHLPVPAHPAQLEHLEVSTVVQVFGGHGLSEGQSILTLPVYTKHARVQPETVLRFRYVLDARPRWEFEHERRPSLLDTPLPNREAASPLGLLHLPRLWHRTQLQKHGSRTAEERDRVRAQLSSVPASEWDLDTELFLALGVEPAPAMERLFRAETLDDVEAWLLAQRADVPRHELIALVTRAR